MAKINYNEALNNLEKISEEIHHQRQSRKAQLLEASCRSQLEHSNKILNRHSYHQSFNRHKSNTNNDHDDLQLENYFENQLEISTESDTRQMMMVRGLYKSATHESLLPPSLRNKPYNLTMTSTRKDGNTNSGESKPEEPSGSGPLVQTTTVDDDIEQWTEIRLSHSNSSSSSYSNQSLLTEQQLETGVEDVQSQHSFLSESSSSDEPKSKVTCTTIFQEDSQSKRQTLGQWLTRSNNLRLSGRRQSLDLLIDAGDKVKDVFSMGFQRVGRTLERRNSESEMNSDNRSNTSDTVTTNSSGYSSVTANSSSSTSTMAADFFMFSRYFQVFSSSQRFKLQILFSPLLRNRFDPKELLSDEQVENLLFNHSVDENGVIVVEQFRTPLKQASNKLSFTSLMI